jgi:hypothetical protein
MEMKRWHDLDPRTRQMIMIGSAVDLALKTAAIVDLARRPADQVRGSKPVWAVALALVNSVGVLPVVYFVAGRRTAEPEVDLVVEPEEPVVVLEREPVPTDLP